MLQTFVILGFRNLFRKNKLFSFINVFGLATGLSCVWLISLFIYDEYTFDQHYSSTDRTYRIVVDFISDGNVTAWAKTSAPIGKYLQGALTEVDQVARIRKNPGTDLLTIGDQSFYEPQLFFGDSTFFNIFNIPFKQGNRETALKNKHSIVISESLARKYFRSTNVVGQTIQYDNAIDLQITGVMEDMIHNSHFVADAIVTFSTLNDLFSEQRLNHWGQFDHYTYVLLSESANPKLIDTKLLQLIRTHAPEWVVEKEVLLMQPIKSIHLNSHRKDEINPNSDPKYSYILGTIALLILVMASINYINLSSATRLNRIKEIIIQKALGADRGILFLYSFIESGIVCCTALILSFLITYLALPQFNASTDKQIELIYNQWLLLPAIAIWLAITIIAGFFQIIQTQSQAGNNLSQIKFSSRNSKFRASLVTFQLCISTFLLIAAWIAMQQFNFLNSSHLGFDGDSVIVVPVKDRSKNDQFKTICSEIERLSGISKASFSSSTPGANNSLTYTYSIAGTTAGEQALSTFITDDSFFDLYNIQLKEGRIINPLSPDTLSDVMLNEAAVKLFGLSEPIGSIVSGKVKGKVVGVVRNFNHASLHDEVQPIIMYHFNPSLRMVSIKLDNPGSGISALQKKWPEFYDGYPLEYEFLNDQIQSLYKSERRLSASYGIFSLVAILIASIGLIGLSTFLLNQKLREISIRKVFGSTNIQIIKWIYIGYLPIIFIASTISILVGYYYMQEWLNGFSYRINLELYYLVCPPIIMSFILLLSTAIQSYKAACTNPVINLRQE